LPCRVRPNTLPPDFAGLAGAKLVKETLMRIRSVALALVAACLAFIVSLPAPVLAGPGVAAVPDVATPLVQEAGYYRRRWRYRDGPYVDSRKETFVAAPFARVYNGRYGTWVRAPFVNLWVPR
jgi:hypothetical protein